LSGISLANKRSISSRLKLPMSSNCTHPFARQARARSKSPIVGSLTNATLPVQASSSIQPQLSVSYPIGLLPSLKPYDQTRRIPSPPILGTNGTPSPRFLQILTATKTVRVLVFGSIQS
jgi:hypothetical protein